MAKSFEVQYQAAGAGTGKTVQMNVYKPDHTKDEDQSAELVEIGTTGRYYGSFEADAPDWSIQIDDDAGGKCIRVFDKPAYDATGVPALVTLLVGNVQTAVDNVAAAIDTLQSLTGTMDGKIDTVGANVDNLITGVASLATELGVIVGKIDALEAPPMIG